MSYSTDLDISLGVITMQNEAVYRNCIRPF